VDLSPLLHQPPFLVTPQATAEPVATTMRHLGLHHMLVVPDVSVHGLIMRADVKVAEGNITATHACVMRQRLRLATRSSG
jgi:predicted transcriptional regulator